MLIAYTSSALRLVWWKTEKVKTSAENSATILLDVLKKLLKLVSLTQFTS
jgi:hypothetical protein